MSISKSIHRKQIPFKKEKLQENNYLKKTPIKWLPEG